jgi:WD40 repeat protein
MSIKSMQAEGQKDLQSLLAFQAYLFNKRNKGLENDADIYAGLYNFDRQYGLTFKTFNGHKGEVRSIAFTPGDQVFFSSGYDGKVLKWNITDKDKEPQVVYSGADIIDILAVSPDGSWLACGSSNSSIRMIPLKNGGAVNELTGHMGKVKSLVYSPDGKYLYSAALDNRILKWDIASGTSVEVTAEGLKINSIDISSDGRYLAGITSEGKAVVWNPETRSENQKIETEGRIIKIVRFKPSLPILAIGDNLGNLELWDIVNLRKTASVKAHTAQINDIKFNPAFNQMATGSNDQKLKIWNVADVTDLTEPPITFADNEGFIMVMQYSPDGQMIVSGSYQGDKNLIGRPSHVNYLVQDICHNISRNMTAEEWNTYVGKDIPFEKTCSAINLNITVNSLKEN